MPVSIVCSIIISIVFKFNFIMTLLSLIIPIIYSLFTGVLGVTINLMFPVLNWDSEVVVVKKDEVKRLLNILKSMPADRRNIFILQHYYGYSYKEISNIIGCPVGTVRSRLRYGIKEIVLRFKERGWMKDLEKLDNRIDITVKN